MKIPGQTLYTISEYVIADRVEHLVMLNGLFCIDPEKPTPGSSTIALAVLISVNYLTCYFQIFLPSFFIFFKLEIGMLIHVQFHLVNLHVQCTLHFLDQSPDENDVFALLNDECTCKAA